MRHLALLALLAACSAAPAPTRCTPGASVACVCPGVGTGAQVCAADGASYGACACGVDAGGGSDASVTPGADATSGSDVVAVVDVPVLDAGGEDRGTVGDGPTDTAPTTDNPRCTPSTLATCVTPSFGEGCWDLRNGNGRIPATHCGECNRACPSEAPECVAGRCTALARDAGTGAVDVPQCTTPGYPAMCLPGSCWDLQTSNGRIPATHCGECGYACPVGFPECVAGRCTALAPDAGR